MQTTEGQKSVLQSLKMVASTGLSLNPQKGEAALVPYNGKCTYQIMKDGYISLAMRTGRVQYICSEEVFDKDEFSISKTMNGDAFDFKPNLRSRGELIGFFAAIQYMDDQGVMQCRVEYMTHEQMEEHRDAFRADKTKKNGPWGTNFASMGRKTVLKRLLTKNKISDKLKDEIGNENQLFKETYDTDSEFVTAEITDVSPAEEIAEEMKNEQSAEQAESDPF